MDKELKLTCEIIKDDKVIELVEGLDRLDDVYDKYLDEIKKKKGMEEIHACVGGGYGYNLFFNEDTLKTECLAWRSHYHFKDYDGNYIYYNCKLRHRSNRDGQMVSLNEHWDSSKLYTEDAGGRRFDITEKEIMDSFVMVRESIHFSNIPTTTPIDIKLNNLK